MKHLILASLVLVASINANAALQCNEELLKIVVAGCGDSHTKCGVRGLKSILAGRSQVEIIHHMCDADLRQPKSEDPLDLHACVENAVKVSSDPKLKMIPNHCAAQHKFVGIGNLKVRNAAGYDKCNRIELAKLLPKRANSNAAGARN